MRKIFMTANLLLVGFAALFCCALGVLYPVRYERQIRAAAAEFGLPPALVAAVVCTESRFRPTAVSSAGACGLMQLLPDTYAFAAGSVDGLGEITDPLSNLRAGCWYLSYLLRSFSLSDALAAYNAGEGRVRAWQAAGLTAYPYPETADYVRKVTAAARAYRYRL